MGPNWWLKRNLEQVQHVWPALDCTLVLWFLMLLFSPLYQVSALLLIMPLWAYTGWFLAQMNARLSNSRLLLTRRTGLKYESYPRFLLATSWTQMWTFYSLLKVIPGNPNKLFSVKSWRIYDLFIKIKLRNSCTLNCRYDTILYLTWILLSALSASLQVIQYCR